MVGFLSVPDERAKKKEGGEVGSRGRKEVGRS